MQLNDLERKRLKPCPFCESPELSARQHGITPKHDVRIECDWCGAEGPQAYATKRDAIRVWNARTNEEIEKAHKGMGGK